MERKNIQFFIDSDLWNFVLDYRFVHIHFVNNEVVDKSNYLWTREEKKECNLSFKLST